MNTTRSKKKVKGRDSGRVSKEVKAWAIEMADGRLLPDGIRPPQLFYYKSAANQEAAHVSCGCRVVRVTISVDPRK